MTENAKKYAFLNHVNASIVLVNQQ